MHNGKFTTRINIYTLNEQLKLHDSAELFIQYNITKALLKHITNKKYNFLNPTSKSLPHIILRPFSSETWQCHNINSFQYANPS